MRLIHSAALVVSTVLLVGAAARAEDFRVQNKVFAGDDKTATTVSTTLFRNGLVYDFLESPQEVTLFDLGRGRIILLCPAKKIKTTVSLIDVNKFTDAIQTQLKPQTEPLPAFLAQPSFNETTNKPDEITLDSDLLRYKIMTEAPASAEGLRQYLEFADWQAKLTPMIKAEAMPPFARMVVNQMLEKQQAMPKEVSLTIFPQEPPRKQVRLRAEHRTQWRLVDSDEKKIDEVGGYLATFSEVSAQQYRQATLPPPPPK